MHKCYSNHAYMHGYCKLLHLIYIFFSLSTSLSLFLSSLTLTSGSLFLYWSSLVSQVSPQLCHHWSPHSLLLTPIAATHADRHSLADHRCYLFSQFDGFGILISGFWWSAAPLLSQVFPQPCHRQSPHSPLLTPIAIASPIAVALADCHCYLFSLFDGFGISISGFWWFWLVGLMILISGFWWFWLVVLGFWWVGWWWRLGIDRWWWFGIDRWWWLGIESIINILLNKCVE